MKFENKNSVSILIYFNNYAFSDDEKKCIVLARERMTTFIKTIISYKQYEKSTCFKLDIRTFRQNYIVATLSTF